MTTPIVKGALAPLSLLALLVAMSPSLHAQQSWDKRIDGPNRFQVLAQFDDMAVLDRETGLVWGACLPTRATTGLTRSRCVT